MNRIRKHFHLGIAWLLRNGPDFRGKGRLAGHLRAGLLECLPAREAIRSVHMRDQSRMTIDLRSATEWLAFYLGRYDDLLAMILSIVPRDGMVLDVGANIGFYTIPLGLAVRPYGGKCVAFEPIPSNFNRLVDNVRMNGLDDVVRVCPLALGDENREAVMLLDDLHGATTGNAALVKNPDLNEGQRERKPVATRMARLDDCVDELGLRDLSCRFLKVDIEGYEPLFFRGAAKFIRSNHPLVLAEVNPPWLARNGFNAEDYLEVFRPEGYAPFLWNKGWVELSHSSALASLRGIESILFVPPEFCRDRLLRPSQ